MKCGKKCEIYSRVVGYYRPVQFWNDGKQKEFEERKPFSIKNSSINLGSTIIDEFRKE